MFLKALTLKGFKSFADATTLQLEPGVTVVVGPNGSGKSNVVDAIAWVLGAQAPSAVRSQKMDDVIFAGTAKRPALGRAEVALTIDNSAGLLPIEFTEITVSRTLFRTGESEYAINGVNCRLLDVQELLSDAGVGRQQHVIVSQGQIDAVLNARPEDRRSIIEEAAGVLKYRRRKEKSERRLDATEGSLLRVQDLLREVRRQLRPLERQADAARRHGALVAELSTLQVFLAGREIAGLRQRLVTLATERGAQGERDAELRTELATLDTAVLAAEAELTARGDTDLGDEMVRVEHLRERAQGHRRGDRRAPPVDGARPRSADGRRRGGQPGGRCRSVERRPRGGARRAAALGPAAEELAEDEAAFAARREESVDAPGRRCAVQRCGERRRRGARRAAHVAGRGRPGGGRVAQARPAAGGPRRAPCASRSADPRQSRRHRRRRGRPRPIWSAELEAAEARRAVAEDRQRAVAAARQAAGDDHARWQSRAEALRMALESARAKAGADLLTGVDGVLGTLLDVVEIDPGWEPAVEAALGEALQAVVVASPAAGRRALEALRSSNVHGAVLALGVVGAPANAPSSDDRSVAAHVRSTRPGIAELVDRLLAGAVRVPSWEEGLDLALTRPEVVIVTEAGDRFGPTGWRLGAAGGGATAAALDEAQQRLAAAERRGGPARHRAGRRRCRAGDRPAGRAGAHPPPRRPRCRVQRGVCGAGDRAARAARGRRRAGRDRAAGRRRGRAVGRRARPDHRAGRGAARPGGRRGRRGIGSPGAQRGPRRARRPGHGAGQPPPPARGAQRRAGANASSCSSAGWPTPSAAWRPTWRPAPRPTSGASPSSGASPPSTGWPSWSSATGPPSSVAIGELQEIRRRQSDEVRAIAARLDEARRSRAEAERQLDELRERARRVELDEAEVRLRLEGAVEALRRDHDIEPDAAIAAPMPELPEGITAAARVRDLDRELRLLGPINPLALEEFTELQERHTFLEAQLEDIRTTRRDLLRVIKAVDLEIQTVFAAAFADVSAHFTQLFDNLFPGGSGRLVLTAPDDLLNTGIEVEAKPSGKNVKKLSLLSGGERSLTALAYLFAVFRSRPSPFYVMDEVEAALDDVNLHRFLGLIHEFRREAQLLIVSHQKRTMEAGDSLLGVTMQPGGSSKVITERVSATA